MWEWSPRDPTYVVLYRQFTTRFLDLAKHFNWLPKPKPLPETTQEALPQQLSHHRQAQPCTISHVPRHQAINVDDAKQSTNNDKWSSSNDNERPYFRTIQPLRAPPAPNIGNNEWSFDNDNDEQLLLQTEQPLQLLPLDLITHSPTLANTT